MVCVGGWGTCLLTLFCGLFYLTDPAEEEEEEEVIRCICGVFRDEGLMIQCEKCLVSACLYKWALDCRAKQLTHSCTNGTVERDMMFKKTTSCQCLSKSLVLNFTKSCLGFIIHSIIFSVFAWSLPVVKDYHFFSVFSVTGRKYFSHISKSIERAEIRFLSSLLCVVICKSVLDCSRSGSTVTVCKSVAQKSTTCVNSVIFEHMTRWLTWFIH